MLRDALGSIVEPTTLPGAPSRDEHPVKPVPSEISATFSFFYHWVGLSLPLVSLTHQTRSTLNPIPSFWLKPVSLLGIDLFLFICGFTTYQVRIAASLTLRAQRCLLFIDVDYSAAFIMILDNNPRGRQAVWLSSAVTGIAVIVVVLRLLTRFYIVRCAGVEDYFVGLSMLCSIGLTICIGIQAQYGMGRHIADLEPQDMGHSLKAFYASLIVYYLSLGLTKTSILLQYQRIFRTRTFRIACRAIMSIVVIYAIWTLFGSIFVCVPIHTF